MQEQPAQEQPARGFASLSPEERREIARRGGQRAHQKGVAHRFTSEEARQAGRKGGDRTSRNREHMAAIGRKGGKARAEAAQSEQAEMNDTTPRTSALRDKQPNEGAYRHN